LSHHCVVSLESNLWRKVFNKSWNTRPSRIPSSSNALSYLQKTIVHFLSEDRLHSRCVVMHQIKIFEVLFLDLATHLVVLFHNVICSDRLSEQSSHEREQSHLLCLVIQKLNFILPPTNVLKLSSNRGISYGDSKSRT